MIQQDWDLDIALLVIYTEMIFSICFVPCIHSSQLHLLVSNRQGGTTSEMHIVNCIASAFNFLLLCCWTGQRRPTLEVFCECLSDDLVDIHEAGVEAVQRFIQCIRLDACTAFGFGT